jgi:hypothetical protein
VNEKTIRSFDISTEEVVTMSYSSARTSAQNATSASPVEAINYLAEAIRLLSRAVEQDVAKIEREISQMKSRLR